MGLRILCDIGREEACFYDSVTDWAFGPVFRGDDAAGLAGKFADWLSADARTFESGELEDLYDTWIKERRAAGEDA